MEAFILPIINILIGPVMKTVQAYINKEITEEQLAEKVKEAMLSAGKDWWNSANNTLAKTYDSFQVTLRSTKIIQVCWAIFFLSQVLFLFFLEMIVPYLVKEQIIHSWAVGDLDKWAMGMIAFCLGAGPYALKAPAPPALPK